MKVVTVNPLDKHHQHLLQIIFRNYESIVKTNDADIEEAKKLQNSGDIQGAQKKWDIVLRRFRQRLDVTKEQSFNASPSAQLNSIKDNWFETFEEIFLQQPINLRFETYTDFTKCFVHVAAKFGSSAVEELDLVFQDMYNAYLKTKDDPTQLSSNYQVIKLDK